MRKILVSAIAVLAIAGMANAMLVTVSSPTDKPSQMAGVPQTITLDVTGGELLQAATINLLISGGSIASAENKAGTIFATSNNVVGAENLAAYNIDGLESPLNALYSDFAMHFGASTAANGRLLSFVVDTTGLAVGDYSILLSNASGGSSAMTATGALDFSNVVGSFTVAPEPAALALLGLGGLFIRRRRA